jgi:sugar lactone lactonase YvrE
MPFRKTNDPRPLIDSVAPAAAIPGGELHVRGQNFMRAGRPSARFGDTSALVVSGSDSLVIVRVPDSLTESDLIVGQNGSVSAPHACAIGVQLADGIHAVASPAVDDFGSIYTTMSGTRGQKTPVSVFRYDLNAGQMSPFVSDILNATSVALDRSGVLYVSSRHEGNVYRVERSGAMSVYVEGMGTATGLAFDPAGNLYVGDRSGTIFKVSPERQIYVFATLESSISAYHLAFGPDDCLYVTGPTTSSYDAVHRINPAGEVELFYRGLGRPQGLAFDAQGNLYVAASHAGQRGIVRIRPQKEAEMFLSGPAIVGHAFAPAGDLIVTTNQALFRVPVGIHGSSLR